VGVATITVCDESGQVIYKETLDTNTTSSVFVQSGDWNAGNYMLTITYGTTFLTGDFVME
jgi:hypothetical protein